jgi:CRP-like cAMP-binding protein
MLATAIRTTAASGFPVVPFDRREMKTAIAALDRIGLVVSLKRDATIFFQEDVATSYFKVIEGVVRHCKFLSDGRRLISDFCVPGEFFGLAGVGKNLWSAEAVTAVALVRWTRRSLDTLVEEQPGVGKCIQSLVSDRIASMQEHMLLLGRKHATEKVASFLLMMADRNGDSERVLLRMTRLDIADYLGLTVETVSRTVTQLRRRRLIRVQDDHEVIFLNRDSIEHLANIA